MALSNLDLAYRGENSAADRARIVAGVYRHLGRMFFESLLLLSRPDVRPLSRFIEIDGLDHAREAVARHGSAIFVTLHLGHWDLLGAAVSERVAPLHAVMRPLRNPRLNGKIVELRRRLGMELIERERAVPALFRCLRRDQSVALVCDLNQKEGPLFVDFFGVPAATVRTPALLALRTGKPILCCSSWSEGGALRYRGRIEPPLQPRLDVDSAAEELRLLTAMNAQFERAIRDHPAQWNWIHPRWKTRPGAAERA